MRDPRPINQPKQNRRKSGANKLEPIDWHEFANDAVLNGNMSTLFHRPPNEDPSAYASPEALVEIEKRSNRPVGVSTPASSSPEPTVGINHTGGFQPSVGTVPAVNSVPTGGIRPTLVAEPEAAPEPPELAGAARNKKIKPIREVHDALTLAGQILYKAMYGAPDGTAPRYCAKGYRQLAAETRLDKDTVRDLIVDFKAKGIVRQVGSYNPDTRSSKTYEVLPNQAIVQLWKEAGFCYVTSGRQRPEFCTAKGQPHPSTPARGGSRNLA